MKNKAFSILFSLFFSSIAVMAQFGPPTQISGPGYILAFNNCNNAPTATCGTVNTYTVVDQNCNPANINSSTYTWQIRDAASATFYINQNTNTSVPIDLPVSNLRLQINTISSDHIELLINILNPANGNPQVFGLTYGNGVGTIGTVTTDCVIEEILDGPGYSPALNCGYNGEAVCGAVSRYHRIAKDFCIPLQSPPASCYPNFSWRINDLGGPIIYLNKADWPQLINTTIDMPNANLRVTLVDIQCEYIDLLIELRNTGSAYCGDAGNFGLSASTTQPGTVNSDCYVPCPPPCNFSCSITSCDGMSCLKVINSTTNPCFGCYCKTVTFTDGTTAYFEFKFDGTSNTTMKCFDKTIDFVTVSNPTVNSISCSTCGIASIKGLLREKSLDSEMDLQLVPNPVDDSFEIIDKDDLSTTGTISDISGRLIKEFQTNGENPMVNVSRLESGTYIVTLFDAQGGFLKTLKFIKE